MKTFRVLIFFILAVLTSCRQSTGCKHDPVPDRYEFKLEQVIVVSRHNVRAPLAKNIEASRRNVTNPSVLMDFSEHGSNLTQKGEALEILMGSYFRTWLTEAGLYMDYCDCLNHDTIPPVKEFYFGASPRERTVASTRAFAAGMLPSVDVVVHHNGYSKPGSLDPSYLPYLVMKDCTFTVDTAWFKQLAENQMREIVDNKKAVLEEAYRLLKKRVGVKIPLSTDNISVDWAFYKGKELKEPETKDDLKAANQISDALILQYYMLPDPSATGIRATKCEWRKIAGIKDIYSEILFTAPVVAVNTSHGLLGKVREGISSGRKFTFLCTHDTSISALLAALGVEYSLPEESTIERLTPNGCKLVVEKYHWMADGKDYARVRMIYQSNEQLRNMTVLDYKKGIHPCSFEIPFKDLEPTSVEGIPFYDWKKFTDKLDTVYCAFYKQHCL